MKPHLGLAGQVARAFIDSKLTPLIVIASVLLGAFAVVMLPREEEPQIKVPMVDVLVAMPGFSAKEVEERATRPMEKLLWEIPGVEYIYSTSRPGESLVIVRFKVGEDMERSIVKLNQKLQQNFDRIPHGVSTPLIKARSIDDVPILALTFHSARYDHLTLRRLVAQVDDAVKQVPLVAETTLIGGARRQVRVLLDPAKLASRNLSPAGLVPMLRQANKQFAAGGLTSENSGSRRSRPARSCKAPKTSATWSSACSAANRSICAKSPRSSTARKSRASMCCSEWRRGPERAAPSRSPSPSARARMPSPSRMKSCAKSKRSKAVRFPPTCPSRSRATTAKPPPRNPTNCSGTWASRWSA